MVLQDEVFCGYRKYLCQDKFSSTFASRKMSFALHNEESHAALRELIDGLVAAGIEHLVKLPSIAVMGDTSSELRTERHLGCGVSV